MHAPARPTRQASSRRFQALVEGSIQGILIHRNAVPLFANQALATLFGYASPEAILQLDTILRLYAPHEWTRLRQYRKARLRGEPVPDRYEVQGVRRDGTAIWLENLVTLVEWNGAPAIQIALVDITSRKQAEAALKARIDRLQTLTRLNRLVSSGLELDNVLHEITRAAAIIGGATAAGCWIADETARTLELRVFSAQRLQADFPMQRLGFDQGGIGWVAIHRRPLNVPDVFVDERLVGLDWWRVHGLRSFYCLPILFEKALLGVLSLHGQDPFRFQPEDRECLDNFVAQAAVAIRNANLYGQALDQTKRLEALVRTSARVASTIQVHELLHSIAEEAAHLLRIEGAGFRLLEGERLVVGSAYGLARHVMRRRALRIGESLTGRVAQEGRPLAIADLQVTRLTIPEHRQAIIRYNVRSYLGVPLRCRERLIGVLNVYGSKQRQFQDHEVGLLSAFADQAAVAIEQAHLLQGAKAHAAELARAYRALQCETAERKRIEDQLRQAQKMEAIGTLAGGIAHDFNNILAAILGYAELTLLDVPPDSHAARNLQEVLTAGHRAKNLVQQILAFSRQHNAERRPLQLHVLIKETLKLLRASIPATITIRQHLEAASDTILADPTQMHQVVMNLCTNAEYAMRPQGGELEVRLEAVEVTPDFAAGHPPLHPGPHVCLTVRDTGCGMSPEVMARIFEPFFTTKGVGEGTGMGLAVVHGIVTGYGGSITVESVEGQGTTFTVYLPRLLAAAVEQHRDCEGPLPRGSECVLLVDDEAPLVQLGQGMLERLGYQVVTRTSSIEALEAFRATPERFDLVITDQTMPNLTGELLARKMRQVRPDIPIILCTGFSHTMTEAKSRDLGIDAFLTKPIVIRDLACTIRQVLARPRLGKHAVG